MEAVLEAVQRTGRGKNEARRLRASGRMPAVVYGGDSPGGKAIAVDPKVLSQILHSEHGREHADRPAHRRAGLPSACWCASTSSTRSPAHCCTPTSTASRWTSKLHVTVPVVVRGEPQGVKQQGGVLDFVHRQIEIECLPADIPEHIDVDVSELMVGQASACGTSLTNAKWKAVSEPDMMLVHVIMPKVEEEPAAPEAAAPAAPAEPEVIKKGKAEKPEEEEEK